MIDGVAGLVLAAGAGRRYGIPKALVEVGGRIQVDSALSALRHGGCAPLVVVLGAGADEVRARADLRDAVVVVNQDWATGMGSSLRAGLAALEFTSVDAVVVMLVDTPGVNAAAVRRLLTRAGSQTLALATYDGQPGHPVVLGRAHWLGVGELAVGDVGARPYLSAHADQLVVVPCEDIADGTDRDEPPAVIP
jgi:CTP:molybdopterin cytidylyltransferase MocA